MRGGFCINCGNRTTFEWISSKHDGEWKCTECGNIQASL